MDLVKRLRAAGRHPMMDNYCKVDVFDVTEAADLIEAQAAQLQEAREVTINVAAHLAAAISLLERGNKAAKKAAASDRMFDQMLTDYRNSLEEARAFLAKSQ